MTDNKDDIENELEGLDTTASGGWGEYPLDTVFVRTETRSVNEVVERIRKDRYKLDPDFQRDFVWPLDKQSRLIESSLMRIPLPVFYVAEDKDGRIIVVDGLQRLTTFFRYIENTFSLKGLESADTENHISGKKFCELPLKLQERIEDTQLTLYILDSKAPERARLDIFDRVNSGVPLTRQQMRNCLYSGKATAWLKEAAQSKEFLNATGNALQKKSMRDREVINRFCAFYLLGYQSYRADMEDFLAKALKEMNKMSDGDLEVMMVAFLGSMKLNNEIFKSHAFRKSLSEGNSNVARTVINVSLFDVLSVSFSRNSELIANNKEKIIGNIRELFWSIEFTHSISYSTNSSKQVRTRFELMGDAINGVWLC